MRDFIVPSSANYTEFLRDYLENNVLPSDLDGANVAFNCNFSDVFKNHYLMREIGFESEELFTHHLKSKSEIVIPYYKKKAEALTIVFNDIFENGFTITQTNNLTNTIVSDDTTDTRKDFTTPTGSATGDLPSSALSGGSINTNNRTGSSTNTGSVTTVYSKNPKYNSLEALTKFQDEFKNIIQECLNEFDNLFMQIY